ncbi:hypothetical protein C8R47DRAFT_570599 [Mycena vitilis]|nr:hypothetical protein C8R47DRAFT_570599 [Mycena vitilis]
MSTPSQFPSASDVVVIESYNGLGGCGVGFAFLQDRVNETGLLVNSSSGSTTEIPHEKWSEFLSCVADAKKVLQENGGGSWSRPSGDSCPTDVFYDLGPADTKAEFVKFQLTEHEIDAGEPENILRYINGKDEVVDEIPPPLVKLESAMRDLTKVRLRKRDSPTVDTKKLLEVVDGMATGSSYGLFA